MFLAREESQRAASLGILPDDVRSILQIPQQMRYGQFVWNETPAPRGKLIVRVDLRKQLISVFRGGHEIGVAVILYGTDDYELRPAAFRFWRKSKTIARQPMTTPPCRTPFD